MGCNSPAVAFAKLSANRVSGVAEHTAPPRSVREDGTSAWIVADPAGRYRIHIAATLPLRRRACALAAGLYRQAGFLRERGTHLLVEPYDALPGTLVLLAEDESGHDAATMTLVCGGNRKPLPADAVFGDELDRLRKQGRRLAEGTRLAIAEEHLFSPVLMHSMLDLLRIHGCLRRATDLLIEINPRHVPYWRRRMGFEPLGPERPCPRVNGAPARLLRLRAEIPAKSASCGKRLATTDESEARAKARFLLRHYRSLPAEDLKRLQPPVPRPVATEALP